MALISNVFNIMAKNLDIFYPDALRKVEPKGYALVYLGNSGGCSIYAAEYYLLLLAKFTPKTRITEEQGRKKVEENLQFGLR